MIMDKRSSYLSERKYQQTGGLDKECYGFWAELQGREKIDYLKRIYPEGVGGYLGGGDYVSTVDLNAGIENLLLYTDTGNEELLPENTVFKEFYLPFTEAAYASLLKRIDEELQLQAKISFFQGLIKILEDICLRTLISEMHNCRDEELLKGENSEEEYDWYVKEFLKDMSYIRELCDMYPVMMRRIAEAMEQFVNLIAAIVLSYRKDRGEIQKLFFAECEIGEIADMEMNISDSHNQGKMVCVLHLDGGEKLVYKPRTLDNESGYQMIAEVISEGCGIDQYKIKMLSRESYSWMEYIEYKSCTSMAELAGYYERLGVHLFISHLLGSGDLHYENMIAMGPYPVMLDMEVFLGIYEELNPKDAAQSVAQKLQDSVLYRGILPFALWNRDGSGVNISIMEGRGGQQVPFKLPVVVNPFTSDMQVEYASPFMEHSKNLPMLNGKFIGARQFTPNLQQGFRKAYEFFLKNNSRIIALVDRFSGIKRRVLYRNTQQYYMYLTLSYHPRFLEDGADREMILYSLYGGQETSRELWIIQSEIRDMLNGDIPYFYQYSNDTALYNSQGECLVGYYQNTAIDLIKKRAEKLDRKDYEQQRRFIDLSMNLLSSESRQSDFAAGPLLDPENKKSSADGKEIITQCVTAIADRILDAAIYSDGYKNVNWIGMTLMETAEPSWQIEPMNNRLYDGVAGLAVFFQAVRRYTKDEKYRTVCEALDRTLFEYTEKLSGIVPDISSTGIFSGESSLIYTYQLLYCITGQEQYLDYAEKHCCFVKAMLAGDRCFDLLAGNAGAIIAFINMHRLTGEQKYVELAATAAEPLFASCIEMEKGAAWPPVVGGTPPLGFSHGTSGIIYALAQLYEFHQEERIPAVICKALAYEASYFDAEHGNWPDLRKPEDGGERRYMVAWCHGAAGVLISRDGILAALDSKDRKKAATGIHLAVKAIAESKELGNYCLCHGNIGNVAILEQIQKKMGDREVFKQCHGYYEWFAKSYLNNNIHFGMQEENNYGFMSGLSGMGYYLLKSIHPELPDVLKLDVSRHN